MSFRVSKRTLFFIAGTVWLVAGINILRIGIVTWQSDSHDWLFRAENERKKLSLFLFRQKGMGDYDFYGNAGHHDT